MANRFPTVSNFLFPFKRVFRSNKFIADVNISQKFSPKKCEKF